MICNKCGARVDYKTSRCPVCGSDIDCSDYPQLYPDYVESPAPARSRYLLVAAIFLTAATVISVIAILVNLLAFPNMLWCLPIVGGLFTVCLAVLHTCNAEFGLGNRSFLLLSMLILDIYLLGICLNNIVFITESLLPTPFVAVGGSVAALCLFIDKRQYYFASIGMGILSFIPLIVNLALKNINIIFSVFAAVLGILIIIIPSIINRRNLGHMYRTFFHI